MKIQLCVECLFNHSILHFKTTEYNKLSAKLIKTAFQDVYYNNNCDKLIAAV